MTDNTNLYARGILMSAAGMLILTPDGLLLRLTSDAGFWNVVFFRSVFIGISLGVFLLLYHRLNIAFLWRGFGRAGMLSTLLMTGSNLCFVGAIANTTVANTLVILATMPLFSALLGRLILSERVGTRTWGSIAVAIGGIVVIFSGSLGAGNWLGDLLALATAILQSLNLVLIRKVKDRDVMTPSLCLSGFIAAALVLPLADPAAVSGENLGLLALMGLFVLPLSLGLFLSGARYAPAAEIALLALIETVLGPLWVWLGVGEVPSSLSLIGGTVVIAAVASNALYGIRQTRRSGR